MGNMQFVTKLLKQGYLIEDIDVEEINKFLRPINFVAVKFLDKIYLKDLKPQEKNLILSEKKMIANGIEALLYEKKIDKNPENLLIKQGYIDKENKFTQHFLVQNSDILIENYENFKNCKLCRLVVQNSDIHSFCKEKY